MKGRSARSRTSSAATGRSLRRTAATALAAALLTVSADAQDERVALRPGWGPTHVLRNQGCGVDWLYPLMLLNGIPVEQVNSLPEGARLRVPANCRGQEPPPEEAALSRMVLSAAAKETEIRETQRLYERLSSSELDRTTAQERIRQLEQEKATAWAELRAKQAELNELQKRLAELSMGPSRPSRYWSGLALALFLL